MFHLTLQSTATLRTLPGPEKLYELAEPFRCSINGLRCDIPARFRTDLASVPKIFHGLIDDNDTDILRPSLVHDYLYQYRGCPPHSNLHFTRSESDAILREGMRLCGAGWLRRWTVYLAVRLGGKGPWDSHQIRRLSFYPRP